MIKLLVKRHNTTGLKYLCKTTKEDHVSYHGSGVYWKNHINKHGKDISTELIFQTEDMKEFKEVALEYSRKLNIVESSDWANLIEENGAGGKTSGSFKPGCKSPNEGKIQPSVSEHKKQYWIKWRELNPNYKSKWATYNPIGFSAEERLNRSVKAVERNKTIATCSKCGKVANIGNIGRWHNDRCTKS